MNNKKVIDLPNINTEEDIRIATGIKDLDTLLGGGFMKGTALLLAGEPGTGKSTLILQLASLMAEQDHKVLYGCGEESLSQIKLRADRLNAVSKNITCSESVNLEDIMRVADEKNSNFIIIDSLQTIYSTTLKQFAGSPTQMKFCLATLINYARKTGKILIIIGQATKGREVGGLLAFQHMVDIVWFLAIDINTRRKLQIIKNRYGPAQTGWEIWMSEKGFEEITKEESHASANETINAMSEDLSKQSKVIDRLISNSNWLGFLIQLTISIVSLFFWMLSLVFTLITIFFKAIREKRLGKRK